MVGLFALWTGSDQIIFHQSDLGAWARCPAQFGFQREGMPRKQTSAIAYGVVMHHCLHLLESLVATGTALVDAAAMAVGEFEKYWHPMNIEALTEPIPADGWIRGQGYSELRTRGIQSLRVYADIMRFDQMELLGLEYGFMVPIHGTWDEELGEPHILAGTIDRLAARYHRRVLTLCVDDYKGVALDTPIPTPDGWTTMRDVAVGDQVFDRDGRSTTVIGKSDVNYKTCYRIVFDDSSSVVCDEDHQWVLTVGRHHVSTVMSARAIADRGVKGEVAPGRYQRDLRIPNPAPLDLPEAKLPVDPYVYGYWLGNGTRDRGAITAHADDFAIISEIFATRGFPLGATWRKGDGISGTALGLSAALRRAGLRGTRRISSEYLRANVSQRLELLRGLCDADGHAHATRHEQVFTTTSFELYEGVKDLIAGLGWNQSAWIGPRTGFGHTVTAYDVKFRAVGKVPFRLPRKAAVVPTMAHALSRQRIIQSIERIPTVPTQCIMVDSPSSTFLLGDRMTVSHNTGRAQRFLQHNLQFTAYLYATEQPEFWVGWRGEDGFGAERGAQLYERFKDVPRRAFWINFKELKNQDAGFRDERHYRRFVLAVNQVAASVQAEIYPLTISGEACTYCEFRDICGDAPVPPEDFDPTLEPIGA